MDITTQGLVGLACFLSTVSDQQAEQVYQALDHEQQEVVQEMELNCLPPSFERFLEENDLAVVGSDEIYSERAMPTETLRMDTVQPTATLRMRSISQPCATLPQAEERIEVE